MIRKHGGVWCTHIKTNDIRASMRELMIPLEDVRRVMFWRACCRLCNWLGLRARDETTTHRARLWIQTRTIRAHLQVRNLLDPDWPRR